MSSQNILDFVVIGSQKCATTWMYDCLKDHPQLNLRNSKNEDAYYNSKLYKEKGDELYFSQFKNNKLFKGCISVEYIEDLESPFVLSELNPNMRIIASLRQPADRAISAYQWYVRKAVIPNIPIENGILETIKHFQGDLLNEYTPAYKNIIERGFYAQRLKNWYTTFPEEQLKIIFYDEVKKSPISAIENIMSFIGVDNSFVPNNLNTKPKKNGGFDVLVKLNHRFPNSKIVSNGVDLINQFFFNMKVSPALKISASTKEKLQGLYSNSLIELDNLFAKFNTSTQKKMHEFWNN